jgi:ATP-dependent protease ClpP protease subunit
VAESKKPILLRINTPGGDEIAGLSVVDFVLGVRQGGVPIDTLVMGEGASMGSILMQCGETRYITQSSVVLIHESRYFFEDSKWVEKISDLEERLRLGRLLERRANELIAERSVFDGNVEELMAAYGSSDWWLTAEEAVWLGFADEIWRSA